METGYLLIEHDCEEKSYNVFYTREEAEEEFIMKAREYAKDFNEHAVLANDDDDMKAMAEDGVYAPNHELVLEIVECGINTQAHDEELRTKIAFCNFEEDDWPEDIKKHLMDHDTDDYCDRENKKTGKSAVVWEPFEKRSNQELIDFIEEGKF